MAERLRCRLCDRTMVVSEEDPDATVSDMLDHVAMRHARVVHLGDPNVIILELMMLGPTRRLEVTWPMTCVYNCRCRSCPPGFDLQRLKALATIAPSREGLPLVWGAGEGLPSGAEEPAPRNIACHIASKFGSDSSTPAYRCLRP